MSRIRPPRRLLAGAVVAAVALGACGVPSDQEAVVDDPDRVPFGLLDPAPPAGGEEQTEMVDGESDETPDPTEDVVTVYFVTPENRVVPVQRTVPAPATFEDVIDVLSEGPTATESEAGLRSTLPGLDFVEFGQLTGGVATVDLSQAIQALDGVNQLLAIAQVVFTLTSRPGVGRVAFTLEGGAVEVPRGDGSLTSGSVSQDSYVELVDPTAAPTTTTAPAEQAAMAS